MKRILLILLLLNFFTAANAGNYPTHIGYCANSQGFGGMALKFTNIGNASQALIGGNGGCFISPNFYFGGGGYGTYNSNGTIEIEDNNVIRRPKLDIGYGGVIMGYVKRLNNNFSLNVNNMIGFGGFTLKDNNFEADQGFVVIEPEVNLYISPTEWWHLGFGVGYRFANLSDGYVSNSIFNKPTINIKFSFGKF